MRGCYRESLRARRRQHPPRTRFAARSKPFGPSLLHSACAQPMGQWPRWRTPALNGRTQAFRKDRIRSRYRSSGASSRRHAKGGLSGRLTAGSPDIPSISTLPKAPRSRSPAGVSLPSLYKIGIHRSLQAPSNRQVFDLQGVFVTRAMDSCKRSVRQPVNVPERRKSGVDAMHGQATASLGSNYPHPRAYIQHACCSQRVSGA